MENTINKLKTIDAVLFEKYGIDSYAERCLIHEVIDEIEALILPVVSCMLKDGQKIDIDDYDLNEVWELDPNYVSKHGNILDSVDPSTVKIEWIKRRPLITD